MGLKKDNLWIAIEISVTTKAVQEISNIRKCLEAGYDYIICVSSEKKQLSLLKTEAKKSFTMRERERVRFCLPPKVKTILKDLSPTGIVSEKGIVSGLLTKQKQLMNTKEAAEFLGVSKSTLYEWVVQKKIPLYKSRMVN